MIIIIIINVNDYTTMANIVITESQLMMLHNRLDEDKVLRGEFTNSLKDFMKNLQNDPLHGELPSLFKDNGIGRNDLINKMIDCGMVSRNEGFDEISESKKHSVHKLSYKFHGQDFENKKDKLYNSLFQINEEGEMGGGALGGCNVMVGSSDESGGISYPFGGIQRKAGYNAHKSKKDSGDVTKQESNVDMSPAMKRDKIHGISMNRKK